MATIDKTASNSIRMKSSRLSLKAQKNLSDISPAPVPRSSHRIRSSSAEFDDKPKTNSTSKRGQAGSPTVSQLSQSQTSTLEHKEDIHYSLFNGFNSSGRVHGICPLANLGNTCFLNSVLYALRFLPGFVHDLHHMYSYLQVSSNQNVTSSLSQRMNFLSELHNVFSLLKNEESNISEGKKIPALHPLQFLESLRSVNPQFEGNKQQDAHELLHCLLDLLFNLPQDYVKNENSVEEPLKPPKSKKRKRNVKILKDLNTPKIFDIVGSKFVGQMSLETRCVECEQINRREENFLEVCVPVKTKSDLDDDEEELSDTDILLNALCTEEGLVGSNKYWCDFCHHHNEAGRSVHYRQLPHNLLIHVKRFSSYSRTFATKCCDAMPAPFQLPCFCYECLHQEEQHNKKGQNGFKSESAEHEVDLSASHLPYFLTAFVCHLGATISSGHYISFVHVNSRSLSSCLEKQLETEENISKSNFECSFLRCCSSHLDRLLSSGICNGKDGFSGPIPSEGVWLECDDEKIRIVPFAEVSAVMTSNNLTPYLLFYSRCR